MRRQINYYNDHLWVCDVLDNSNTSYFVEFFTGSGYNSYGYYTPTNPGDNTVISNNYFGEMVVKVVGI